MMDRKRYLLEKVGGYGILLLLLLLFVIGWQAGLGDSLAGEGDVAAGGTVGETAVSAILDTRPTAEATDVAIEPVENGLFNIPIINDNSLAPAPIPNTYQGELPTHEFVTYIVERGDTPGTIADRFGISTETLLGGNAFLSQESSLLQTDVELTILPIDGVLHDVQPGDTLEGLSTLYGIAVEEIAAYVPNQLAFPYRLYPDTQILVPGAVREVFVWTPPDLSSVTANSSYEGSGVAPIIVGTGSFIFPVSARSFTQRYWYGHQAVDIGLPDGSAVFAADTGTVTYSGWNVYGYGNLIVVNHGNGYETFYAHLSSMNVVPGQIVYQGNVIGASGNTGRSSGPHIHFEIRLNNNRDDPCWYLGC